MARLVTWLGVAPFALYTMLFLLIPTLAIVYSAFVSGSGQFTLGNVAMLLQTQYFQAYVSSIELSAVSAAGGGIFGLLVANAVLSNGVPKWLRPLLTTFSGVAANFAGVPLAFAFIATIGPTGLATELLLRAGFNLYHTGFSVFALAGLSLTYIYFELPLMILIITPSLLGVRREWREAAVSLGAGNLQYWRHIGLPIILPTLLGAMVLLFGNAFSAYATPYALSGGFINLVPVLIGAVLSGNVGVNPKAGAALAFGMIIIIALAVSVYALLQRRSSRWLS